MKKGEPMTQLFSKFFAFAALTFFLIFDPAAFGGGQLYRWVDEEGTVHLTENLADVPVKYRDRVAKKPSATEEIGSESPDSKAFQGVSGGAGI